MDYGSFNRRGEQKIACLNWQDCHLESTAEEQTETPSEKKCGVSPNYHFKEATIKAHILICFIALAVTKYMELKTGKSTRKLVKLLRNITDARILNTLTGEEIIMRKEINEEEKQLWKTLTVPY